MEDALEAFTKNLPPTPYVANVLGNTFRRPLREAMGFTYIGPNAANETQTIIIDVDRPTAFFDWDDRGAPAPSLIVRNPANGHAHLFYVLRKPVHHNITSKKNPIRFLGAVEASLRDKLDGDIGYNGPLAKNPHNDKWEVYRRAFYLWDLGYLADFLDLKKHGDNRRNLPPVGLGRNCTIFDRLRKFAYREIRQPLLDYSTWLWRVQSVARAYNDFQEPLNISEIQAIGRSVAKWVWANMSPEGFNRWGEKRRNKSVGTRQARSQDRSARVLDLYNRNMTQREIANLMGISTRQVKRFTAKR